MLQTNSVSQFLEVPPGKIAAVVTALEQRQAPPDLSVPLRTDLSLRRVQRADLAWYRDLFRRVGQDWLWFSRLRMEDAALASILHDPLVELYALSVAGQDEGLLELDCRTAGAIELAFFGVTSALIGKGAGSWLMQQALTLGWAKKPQRLWVHTCTFDHAKALSFYQQHGFVATGRFIEIAEDPRLLGVLPRHLAPHVPLIEG